MPDSSTCLLELWICSFDTTIFSMVDFLGREVYVNCKDERSHLGAAIASSECGSDPVCSALFFEKAEFSPRHNFDDGVFRERMWAV